MRAFLRKCLGRSAVAIFALVVIPVSVQAGPTVHSAAQPDFQDPLANARPVVPEEDPAIGPNRESGSDGSSIQLESDLAPLGRNGEAGLREVETDEIARTVRDEFLGQGRPAGAPSDSGGLDSVADPSDGSSESIVRALINSVPDGTGSVATDQDEQGAAGATATQSLIDATLDSLIVTILNPQLSAEGMVTFSIAGFGEFALLLLQESGGIFLVDMETGTAVKFSESGERRVSGAISANRGGTGQQERAQSNALQRVLETLERNVLPVITSPITLATIVLFGIIWVVWRISARE